MTVIEFFDEEVMENAAGTLLLQPERTVFLYGEGKGAPAFADRLSELLKRRGIKTKIICEKINTSDVEAAYKKIRECVSLWRDCDFDISGGAESVLVAVGMAAKRFDVPLHAVDVNGARVISVNGRAQYAKRYVSFTVDEAVQLHAGRIRYDKRREETYIWERSEKDERDIEKVWDICRSDCGAWNAALGTSRGYRAEKRGAMTLIWSRLRSAKLVRKTDLGVKYKNPLTAYLLEKQGTALEMYTYIAAKSALDSNGEAFFNDGQSGVVIDWRDGRQVENEVDVLLTHGLAMWFVSCKNGTVTSEELYKLSIVAHRFGGRYAKKVLVLSQFEPDKSFTERAAELGVSIIKNVRSMSKKALAKKLMNV